MNRYDRAGLEPRLEDVLSDPLVRLVMRRDGLADSDIWDVVANARSRLADSIAEPYEPVNPALFSVSRCCSVMGLCA